MKKLSFLLLCCWISASAMAQLKIDLVLAATPPANLTEWVNRREVLTLLVTGQPGLPPQNLKIKTEVKTTDGTVIGSTDLARAAVFTFAGSAPTILTATEVLPVENMVFTGKYRSSLQRTGKLPADNYTLCVQLVRPPDYAAASLAVCKNFYLATTQLPTLMKPYNEEVLDAKIAQTAITFRWTPVTPRTTTPATYRLQVFEVLENQTAMQALRSNEPLLDKEVTAATQYIWQPQMSFMSYFTDNQNAGEMPRHPGKMINNEGGNGTGDAGVINTSESNIGKDKKSGQKNINTSEDNLGSGKGGKTAQKNINTSEDNLGSGHNRMFIWTVQTLDDHGLPVTQTDGNGEARSEPAIFYVDSNKDRGSENSSKKKGHVKTIKNDTGNGGG